MREAQTIHAAGESAARYCRAGDSFPSGVRSVVLVAPSEELEALAARLRSALPCTLAIIRETEGEYAGQLMAIGLGPLSRDRAKKYLSSYPTLKPRSTRGGSETG